MSSASMTSPVSIAAPPVSRSASLQWLLPWLYLLVPLVLLVVFFFVPMGMAFWMSLHDYQVDLFHPDFIGLGNYQLLFVNDHFRQVAGNTFLFMVMVVPSMMVLPIPVAIMLNQQIKGVTLFRALIYLPVVVSLVVAGIAWKWLYASDGLVNYGLTLLGLPKIDWLISPDIALWAVALMVIWKGLGYYMLMYLANLQSIPTSLYEAADMDGANVLQKHWHITIPFIRPTLALVAIISTIGGLKVFTEIYVMTRGGPVGATETLVYYIYEQAFSNLNLGTACAAGFLLMILIFALSLIHIQSFYLKAEKEAGYH